MIYPIIAIAGLISYIGIAPLILEYFWPEPIVNSIYS